MTDKKKRLSAKVCWSPSGYLELIIWRTRKNADGQLTLPWDVVSYWAQKRAKQGKKLWILVYLQRFSPNFSKYGSCLQIPYSIFKPFIIFLRNADARLLDKHIPEGSSVALRHRICTMRHFGTGTAQR